MNRSDIRAKAMVVFRRQDQILVNEVREASGHLTGFRIPGGHVEFGERSIDTAIREIKEELNTDIQNVTFLSVFENVFTYNGKVGHEIIFVYTAEFAESRFYESDVIEAFEHSDGQAFNLYWLDPKALPENKPLFPQGLSEFV